MTKPRATGETEREGEEVARKGGREPREEAAGDRNECKIER